MAAARQAEEARQAEATAAETAERVALAAERGRERADADLRELGLRRRVRRLTIAAGVLATGAVVALALSLGLHDRLEVALGNVAALESERAAQDAVTARLRAELAALETTRAGLDESLGLTRALAQQAAREAEALLDQAEAGSRLADEHLALVAGGAGQYNRRTFFTKLVDATQAAATAHPESERLRLLLGTLQGELGTVLASTGLSTRAPEAFADATRTLEPLAGRAQPSPAALVAMAQVHEQAAAFHARSCVAVPPRDPGPGPPAPGRGHQAPTCACTPLTPSARRIASTSPRRWPAWPTSRP
ncbi:MAG: hypothetical protein R3F43_29875 [bacterium]